MESSDDEIAEAASAVVSGYDFRASAPQGSNHDNPERNGVIAPDNDVRVPSRQGSNERNPEPTGTLF